MKPLVLVIARMMTALGVMALSSCAIGSQEPDYLEPAPDWRAVLSASADDAALPLRYQIDLSNPPVQVRVSCRGDGQAIGRLFTELADGRLQSPIGEPLRFPCGPDGTTISGVILPDEDLPVTVYLSIDIDRADRVGDRIRVSIEEIN